MEILRRANAQHTDKPDGTKIDYYLFPEYEIHYNEIPSGTTQVWHHHEKIEETLLILDGELEARWKDENSQEQKTLVRKGDLIRTGNTPHTFANTSSASVSFVVFKLVLSGVSHQDIFKNDKIIDPTEHIK